MTSKLRSWSGRLRGYVVVLENGSLYTRVEASENPFVSRTRSRAESEIAGQNLTGARIVPAVATWTIREAACAKEEAAHGT